MPKVRCEAQVPDRGRLSLSPSGLPLGPPCTLRRHGTPLCQDAGWYRRSLTAGQAINPGPPLDPSHVSVSSGAAGCTDAASGVNKALQTVTLDDGSSHDPDGCADIGCTAAANDFAKDLQAVTLDDGARSDVGFGPALDFSGRVDERYKTRVLDDTRAARHLSSAFGSFDFGGDCSSRPAAGCNPAFGSNSFDARASPLMPPLRGGGRWSQDDKDLVNKLLALLASPKGNVEQQLKMMLTQHRSDRKSRWQRPKAQQKGWNAAPSGDPTPRPWRNPARDAASAQVPAARRWAKTKSHKPPAQDEPSGWEHYAWHLRKEDWVTEEGINLQVLNALEDLGDALDTDDSGHVVVRVGSLDEATEALEMIAATPASCGTLVLPGPAVGESALPEAVADFRPVLSHCRVPGKLGPKLQTRPATLLSFGSGPPRLRSRAAPAVKLVSKNSSSWVCALPLTGTTRVTTGSCYRNSPGACCGNGSRLPFLATKRPMVTRGAGVVLATPRFKA